MEWKNELQPQRDSLVARSGDVRCAIMATEDGRVWRHLLVSFGSHSDESPQDAMATWPRDAIAMAREKLDDLERYLDEEADE